MTSVIVPTYNRARLFPNAIHGILAQSKGVDEIIVWDDGSTDETPKVLSELGAILRMAENVPAFRCFEAEHAGFAHSINSALAKVQGRYVWICRDNALLLPHAVELLASELDSDSGLVAVGGSYRQVANGSDADQRQEKPPECWPDQSTGSVLRHMLESDFLRQSGMLVRKTALEAVGPFVSQKHGGSGYEMRLRLACYGPIKVLNDPIFLQPEHKDGITASEGAVIETMRRRIPLAFYESMYRSEDLKVVRRAALLQRACVFARRADWSSAVKDYTDAAKLAPSFRLSTVEKAICKRAFEGRPDTSETLPADMRKSLRAVANMSAAGGSIARTLAKEMAMRGRLTEAALIGRFVTSMTYLTGGHGRGEEPAFIIESDALPDHVYRVI